MSRPSLVIFGPQTSWPNSHYLSQLRAVLLLEPRLKTFLAAIKELPDLWRALVKNDSRLENTIPGLEHLQGLWEWIDYGTSPVKYGGVPPNILSMPFTIILQITQYFHYLSGTGCELLHAQVLENAKIGGVQGFCTGILTTIAVACSKDEEDVNRLGAVAMRLAVCVGAYVDMDDLSADESFESVSLAIRWRSEDGLDRVLETLKSYPNAYISVIRDSADVNITTPKEMMSPLSQDLSAQGMTIKSTGLGGRCHSDVHKSAVQRIDKLCNSTPNLQFPAVDKLLVPVRSNSTAQIFTTGSLHQHAVKNILVDLANWHLTISAAASKLTKIENPLVVSFGLIECIPPSIVRESGRKITWMKSSNLFPSKLFGSESLLSSGVVTPATSTRDERYPDHAIAVVGMACKFPGADSIDEFWRLLVSGTSMLREMPEDKFSTQGGPRRVSDDKQQFWGNFVRDIDAFDHRFFKKSSREAASMDPQQRLLLQVAYEAMESSGYFGNPSPTPNDIGCFIGACASDYNDNVASHPPNAYSSLGTLRAFLSGKISHYFGWTGPSVTYDTACSSSTVAIHAACKAIESGECSQAVAGGVSLYTSPFFYQNLAAASFLSPTGATKPFDAKADGYCRGEGAGLVVLKKLSSAVLDGDVVLGVISGSAVNQNSNSTSITVPHSPSQIDLYRKVSSIAGVNPFDVSFVEAHGTGTPVGDPIEFESIRSVFGGKQRARPLHIASVKGNIGHLEGASGVAALIKTLLMMQHKMIPVQANFTNLNPKIPALEPDRLVIPLTTQEWDIDFRVACINNYGAAGSNAAMIVCDPPPRASFSYHPDGDQTKTPSLSKYPIFISASSASSLEAYLRALSTQISSQTFSKDLTTTAFNLADKQNRSLSHFLATTASSLTDLNDQLFAEVSRSGLNAPQPFVNPKGKPLILVFGGQVSNVIGLDKGVYNGSSLFRFHLDHCDTVLHSIGLPGLYPEIFQKDSVGDIIKLHCMLFSLQYACAKSWIESGLRVDALIGHSFGQLTALSVSGALSLQDGLKLISGRASLMQKSWGTEKGAMISVEADMNTLMDLLSSISTTLRDHKIEVACYNGPKSHVLVGSKSSVQALENILVNRIPFIKFKILNVTHGFHSVLTEPFLPHLTKLAEELTFKEPNIPIETCSKDRSWLRAEPHLVAEHTRMPVFFEQAVRRLASRFGSCTWLEAGSNSPVVGMVRGVLEITANCSHSFQPIRLNIAGASEALADATVNLWRSGHKNVQFWPFHRRQKQEYSSMNLPPYQFEKTRHWLPWLENVQLAPPAEVTKVETKPKLLSFLNFRDQSHREADFCVNPRSTEYSLYVQGHAVLANPLCPAPLYIELASQAATTVSGPTTYLPCVEDLEIQAPLGMNICRAISMTLKRIEGEQLAWTFELSSTKPGENSKKAGSPQSHATGRVRLQVESLRMLEDFSRYERLIGYHRLDILRNDPDSEAIQGSMIYKVFAKVVEYAEYYKGVRSIFSKNNEVAGTVSLPKHDLSPLKNTITNPLAIDNFIQVAGLHVNSLSECEDNKVFVCTKVNRIQFNLKFKDSDTGSWVVYSNFSEAEGKEVVNDIFAFEPETKSLVLMILGVRFVKVPVSSLTTVLSRANMVGAETAIIAVAVDASRKPVQNLSDRDPVLPAVTGASYAKTHAGRKPSDSREETIMSQDLDLQIRQLLNKVAEVPMDQLNADSTLEELGIDSLMITEVYNEVCKQFEVEISVSEFQSLIDLKSLRDILLNRGFGGRGKTVTLDPRSDSTPVNTTSLSSQSTIISTGSAPRLQTDLNCQLAKIVASNLEVDVEAMTRDANLAAEGLDSLLCIELANDIKQIFNVVIDMSLLDGESTFGDLADMVTSKRISTPSIEACDRGTLPSNSTAVSQPSSSAEKLSLTALSNKSALLSHSQQSFEEIRHNYDVFAKETGFINFWRSVYPSQAQLVLAYTVEAFSSLECPLAALQPGQRIPLVQVLPKHSLLVDQLYKILKDASLIATNGSDLVRTDITVNGTPSDTLFREILREFPEYASEHRLLHTTGSRLAECLSGAADPVQLLFRRKEDKELLEDVYTNGPMYAAITKLLGAFLAKAYANPTERGTIHILELGGGLGGTTKYIVNFLVRLGIPFTYHFTDVVGSLVAAAKKKFADREFMEFGVLDIEKPPPEKFLRKYHTIISTNCIHATSNLAKSAANIRQMLRSDGFVSLVEFTRNIFWFDLVFGFLDGWWLFEDGRTHVLADQWFWDSKMRTAGFKHVTWTDGSSAEARTLRIIAGFPAEPESESLKPAPLKQRLERPMETVLYRQVGQSCLYADIYYPFDIIKAKRPIALMIHGGGHVMFTRKEVNPKQIRHLLENGFLPVSVDYRFCPELNLLEGPMADVCEALRWARYQLPTMKLDCPGLQIDGERVVVVGWSTGGHLAMTLAFTAPQWGLRPPEAVLGFYCPTDYEDQWWEKPIFPTASVSSPSEEYDLLEGVQDQPVVKIASYYPSVNKNAGGMLMSLKDPRWRFVLHMNWKAQTVPFLLGRIPSKSKVVDIDVSPWDKLDQPPSERVAAISPYAQILRGNYRTPTYLIHGTADDLIPLEQSQRCHEALVSQGVSAGLYVLEGAEHLFDTFSPMGWEAIQAGYDFLFRHVEIAG